MTVCYHFEEEQKELKKQLNDLSLISKVIFTTKEEIKAALQFLKKTKVEIRKWLLRKVNYEKNEIENWKLIDNQQQHDETVMDKKYSD